MKCAIVTGADGFLGRHVVPALRAAGWDVVALDREAADITDAGAALARVRPAALLIHLAFPTRASERRERPVDAFRDAAVGTANALLLAERAGARHVVLASSGKVYGTPRTLPIPEEHPVAPTTWLGRLKSLQEAALGAAARGPARIGVTSLRVFNAWGPGQRGDFVVPRLLAGWRAGVALRLGELDHGRDFVHADDVARAVVVAADHPAACGEVRAWNVGTGRATSVRELAAALARISGRDVPIEQDAALLRPHESPAEAARCDALHAHGWRPTVPLDDGLRRLWFEA